MSKTTKSVSIEQLLAALKVAAVTDGQKQTVLTELKKAAAEEAKADQGAAEDTPKSKNTYTVFLADEAGTFAGRDLVGWIVQHPDDLGAAQVEEKLRFVLESYGSTRKGRRFPVKTTGEFFEAVPDTQFKAIDLSRKTREPIVIRSLGAIEMPVHKAGSDNVVAA